MKNQRVLFILICFLLINISTQFSVFADEKWHKVETDNFTLIGNAKEKKIRKVGIKLEQFKESIKRLVPTLSKSSPISTTVIVFKDENSFQPYKPVNSKGEVTEWVAGYFQAGLDNNYIAITLDNKGANAYQTIFHEYTHNLIDHNIGRSNIPTWLGEGLAEYYDQFTVKNDQIVRFGGRNNLHVALLRKQRMMPLEEFFSVDYKDLHKMSQNEAGIYYSQAWAITHFFMQGMGGKRKPQFDKFIKLISQKVPVKLAFKDSFNLKYEDLWISLEEHINSDSIGQKAKRFTTKLTKNLKTQSKSLSMAEVYANLGDLLYQRKKIDESEKLLRKALSLNPNLSQANATLGMLQMKQEKYELARKSLLLAKNSPDADYLSHYRYAYFLSREVLHLDTFISNYSDERAFEMRKSLLQSVKLNPSFPDSYRLLGFINLVRNERLNEGIVYLNKALKITPNNQSYLVDLANLYHRNKDLKSAKKTAKLVVKINNDKDLVSRAKDILENIEIIENEEKLAKLNKLKSLDAIEDNKTIPKKKGRRVLSEYELERNRRQTDSELISEVLDKPKAGEKRIVGQIAKVACKKDKVILDVEIDKEKKVFHTKNLQQIKMKTYTPVMQNGLFTCTLEKENVLAVFIYKPSNQVDSNILGELISIEFVPNNFVLTSEN